ncbi:hypothetical protein [Pseudomonas sp. FH1]|uniref:hypothetical protein n=1 Tax=Pseudomonas sp. FH1 TaxID=1284392 RepID=UPI00053B39A6|nr:hypothetical protein [Pseudomonas sp. FH1]
MSDSDRILQQNDQEDIVDMLRMLEDSIDFDPERVTIVNRPAHNEFCNDEGTFAASICSF